MDKKTALKIKNGEIKERRKEKRIVQKVQWEDLEGVTETWQIIERNY